MMEKPNTQIRETLKAIARTQRGVYFTFIDLKELIEKYKPKDSGLRAENITNKTLGHCLRSVDNAERKYIKFKDNGYHIKVLLVRFT